MIRDLGRPREFPYRSNSLNLFRLVLAFLVLVAHAFFTAGLGWSPGFNGENLGGWAVIGFFVISGFLITRSRLRTGAGEFLVHRIARIMPAFVVCLILTALVFAPIAQLAIHGTLSGFLSSAPTPLEYIWGNLFLHIDHYGIGQTLSGLPYPDAWNGSLWTLYFEFICYLVVWALGALAVFRRSVLLAAVLWLGSVAVRALNAAGFSGGLDADFGLLARLLPYFLAGALVYLVVQRWGFVPLIGIASIPVAALLMWLVPTLGGPLAAPLLCYALLYLSTVVPQPQWVARNDVSYGFYIYAWPMQQLVVIFGGAQFGIVVYIVITAVITALLATASWFLVERPVMRMARRRSAAAVTQTAQP